MGRPLPIYKHAQRPMDSDLQYHLGEFPWYASSREEKEAWYQKAGEIRLGPAPYPEMNVMKYVHIEMGRNPMFGNEKQKSWKEIGEKCSLPPSVCKKFWNEILQRAQDLGVEIDFHTPERVYAPLLRTAPYDVLTEEEVHRLIARATESREQRAKGWKDDCE